MPRKIFGINRGKLRGEGKNLVAWRFINFYHPNLNAHAYIDKHI